MSEARAGRFPGPSLIPALDALQREHGWLPRAALEGLSRETRRPLYEIQGLVSFYPHFRTDGPPAAVEVALCQDLSCWLHDGEAAIAEAHARFGADADVHLTRVSCLGRCDAAPACAVNEQPARVAELPALVEAARAGALPEAEARRPGREWPNDPYAGERGAPGYRVLRRVLGGEIAPEAVLDTLEASGLRGMGGAGFPTAAKWRLVRDQAEPRRHAICNADESEPGTFKDRQIMAEQPHLVLEGMLVGMLVTGCAEGTVFVRHEYGPETRVIAEEIARLRAEGLLDGLELEVFVSPGGYILGEETALIECMEGHRGEPRNKPPFPGVAGLWGRPTLMNSVETFAHVPVILERGAGWWTAQGVNGGIGLKFLSISGHVDAPDVLCVPMGTPLREVVARAGGVAGGRPLAAVQPGGASSNFLGPDRLDTPLDFRPLQEAGSMLGSGAMVLVAEGTDLLAAAVNVLRFFRDESCGKCVPCRAGSHKAHEILTDLLGSGGGPADVDGRIADLEEAMRLTSICGLGQVALGPVMSVVRMEEPAVPDAPEDEPQAGRASMSDQP